MQAQQVKNFRGVWRAGVNYDAGDIVARGRWSYEAIGGSHVAGGQSEPAFGAHWAMFWRPLDGVAEGGPAAVSIAPAPSLVSVPALVASNVTPLAPPPVSRAEPVSSSEIPDDSDVGGVNVSHSLSMLKGMLSAAARREEIGQLLEILRRLERRIDAAGAPAIEDPVTSEAWRRKCDLLAVATRSEAEAEMGRMTREYVRLLRKRDRGQTLTSGEAARFAVLDILDAGLAAIEEREAALRDCAPQDVTADRHWPVIGGAS